MFFLQYYRWFEDSHPFQFWDNVIADEIMNLTIHQNGESQLYVEGPELEQT